MTATEQIRAAIADRYVIERELGAGGMATVYLAQDVKHDRKVALKVLRPELAAIIGAERFLQEIKVTANLQHPHILPLFDSGAAGSFLYYVMPYVEGETLREKLTREKQLSIQEAVRIAREAADGLDYVHRHGVVHRDIKPENILLHDGRALVADFGIALAVSQAGAGRMTETGMSLGTPHYMSPEQAMGEREITPKSDVYALGCVLYEMLTGEPPFTGPTAQAIVAQVVTESPRPLLPQRHTIPPHVEATVLQALEKLPADRFATAAEFAAALTGTAQGRSSPRASPVPAPSTEGASRPRWLVPAAAGVIVALSGLAAWGWLRPGRTADGPLAFHISLTPGDSAAQFVSVDVAITPDGRGIVFSDSVGSTRQLWIKRRGNPEPQPIPGTQGGRAPFLSPDGAHIAYTVGNRLMRIPLAGGSPVRLSDSASLNFLHAGVWLEDGTIVAVGGGADFLMAVPAGGGAPRRVITLDALRGFPMHLSAIPGRREVLATICDFAGVCPNGRVDVLNIDDASLRTVLPECVGAWMLEGHRVLYVLPDGSAFVAAWRSDGTLAAGEPVFAGVAIGQTGAQLAVNARGTVLYAEGPGSTNANRSALVAAGAAGFRRVDSLWTGAIAQNSNLDLSPDGRRVVLSMADPATGESAVYVKDLVGGAVTRVSNDGTRNIRASWNPDGVHVVWISDRRGRFEGWQARADGGEPTLLVTEARDLYDVRFSPDGAWLLYRTDDVAPGKGDIYARRTAGDTVTIAVAATEAEETSPAVSPDGRWVVYTIGLSGAKQVIARPFPNVQDGRVQVSIDGGSEPGWSADGRTVYYRGKDGATFTAARVTTTDGLRVVDRTTLFTRRSDHRNDDSRTWSVMPDGSVLLLHWIGAEGRGAGRLILREHSLPTTPRQP